jgi:Zn ribbon nucleic-acid-binding protein
MNMVATAPVKNSKQLFECMRCGHQELRRSATVMYHAGDNAQQIPG